MSVTITLTKEKREKDEETQPKQLATSHAYLCLLCSRRQANEQRMRKMECTHWCCVDCQEEAVRRARRFGWTRRDCLKCQQDEQSSSTEVVPLDERNHHIYHHNELRFSLLTNRCSTCECSVDDTNIFKMECGHLCCHECRDEALSLTQVGNEPLRNTNCLNCLRNVKEISHIRNEERSIQNNGRQQETRQGSKYACQICSRSDEALNALAEPWVVLSGCKHSFCESCIKATMAINRNRGVIPPWSCTVCSSSILKNNG